MIKLLVTDLDGTLLDDEKHVGWRNQKAITRATEEGIAICFASARTGREVQVVMDIFRHQFHAISQNGCFVRTSKGQNLYALYFDEDVAGEVLQLSNPYPVALFLATAEAAIYTPKKTLAYAPIEARMFIECRQNENLRLALRQGLKAAKFSFYGDIRVLRELQLEFIERLADKINPVISDKDCLDVMPRGASKGNAVSLLMNHLSLVPEEVACVGDSFNDISMFQACRHSFAMADSPSPVQSQASHVVSSVAEAISWLLDYNFGNAKRDGLNF